MLRSTLLSLVAALALAPSAFADSFTFTFSGTGVSGNLTLYGSPDATIPNTEDIGAVSGSVLFNGVTSLVTSTPLGSYDPSNPSRTPDLFTAGSKAYWFTYDNLLYTTGVPFDSAGLVFVTADGETVNLCNCDAGKLTFNNTTVFEANLLTSPGVDLTYSLTPTPEPSSLLLLGTGSLACLGMLRRKLVGEKA